MRLFENANYPFIQYRRIGYGLSFVLIIASLAGIFTRGLQYGIDFRGGTEVVIEMSIPVPANEVRYSLSDEIPSLSMVRNFGSDHELQLRFSSVEREKLIMDIQETFRVYFPDNSISIVKADTIGPAFAQDMRDAALTATLLSVAAIALYIFIRFKQFSFSMVVITTLVHDVIIILGTFTLLHGYLPFSMDLDQSLVAAFLTIIGYSLNDTIVVFDRIRENQRIHKGEPWDVIVNTSINQTLSRTVVTSLTTLLAVTVLFLMGGASLQGFSFAIICGVVLGTYSTIWISCPLLVESLKHHVKKETDQIIKKTKKQGIAA